MDHAVEAAPPKSRHSTCPSPTRHNETRTLNEARTAREVANEGSDESATRCHDGGLGSGVDLVWDGGSGDAGRRAGNRVQAYLRHSREGHLWRLVEAHVAGRARRPRMERGDGRAGGAGGFDRRSPTLRSSPRLVAPASRARG